MKPIVTGGEMKAIDTYTIKEIGIPSPVLMERAALSVVSHLKERITKEDEILCICGAGNNGGDGIAAARILYTEGYKASYYMAGNPEKETDETKLQIRIADGIGVPSVTAFEPVRWTVVVDALFGIGLKSGVRKPYDALIEAVNVWRRSDESRIVAAVDIPSGISSDTGQVLGAALKADLTVTFGFNKRGLLLYPGRDYGGTCFVEDIGFPEKALLENPPTAFSYDVQDFEQLPLRKNDSNKGSYGKILVIAGSENMSGAAYFAGCAAYYSGSGLVRILTVKSNRVILQTQFPQAMISIWEDMDDSKLSALLEWSDAVIIGPGIGKDEQMVYRIERTLKLSRRPTVIDADGLNMLAEHSEWYDFLPENTVLTPHMGEMSRLTGEDISELKADRGYYAEKFARNHHLICVLKDSSTVVSDGRSVYINQSGCHGMATGGSGDVLAGITGSLIGSGMPVFEAACMGVYLHGCGGEAASESFSARGMTAVELLQGIRKVLRKTEKKD